MIIRYLVKWEETVRTFQAKCFRSPVFLDCMVLKLLQPNSTPIFSLQLKLKDYFLKNIVERL